MDFKLVSLITPCYNGEKYVHRILDSVLGQSYPRIEMIVVDDGSVDNTSNIVKSYIPKFESRGYTLKCIWQENSGQSVAINKALKLFSGDFLAWPDSDDFYAASNAIEILVSKLIKSDDTVGMVRCLINYLSETDLTLLKKQTLNMQMLKKNELFEDCLFERNEFWYIPGGYMVKREVLKECIPELDIFTDKKAGQNWQLMLPILHKYKCLTIGEYLYNVLVRSESHSRGQFKTYEEIQSKFEVYSRTIIETINLIPFMPTADKDYYKNQIYWKYEAQKIDTLFIFNKKREAISQYKVVMSNSPQWINLKLKIQYVLCYIPKGNNIFQFMVKLKRKI